MTEQAFIDVIRANLRRAMASHDLKPTTLSLNVGSSPTLVADILRKNNDVSVGTLRKLATALDMDIEGLLSSSPITVSGYIGAGGVVIFEDVSEGQDADYVPRPPRISGELLALEVRGDSMLPKYREGDIIYVAQEAQGYLVDFLGEDCAVRLTSGETYLKQLAHGSQKGRFTLRSLNAADMVDVEIDWASPVVFIMPKRARKLSM